MTTKLMPVAANNDAELVVGTLAGNRDAFSHIVSRYQSLICSLTYSATGNLGQSEDLAQETFITAWKHLSQLRERDRLRSWLCGIARNRINNFLRREGREPLHRAGELDEVSETHSPEPLPVEYTISNEEQAILWRSLERIPEIYREPLVLFYREYQSIEAVAEKLELTEDNVKQRLSRGRKLLNEEVTAFVEGALAKTNPGKAFTLGVLAALPAFTFSAKAATVGVTAAKGGTIAKTAAASGLFTAMLAPALGFFGNYIGYRIGMDGAQSDHEREHMRSFYRKLLACMLGFCAAYCLLMIWAKQFGSMSLTQIEFRVLLPPVFAVALFLAFQKTLATDRAARVFGRNGMNRVFGRHWLVCRMLGLHIFFLKCILQLLKFYDLFAEFCRNFFVVHIPRILRPRKWPAEELPAL